MRGCEDVKEGGGGLVGGKDAQSHDGHGQLHYQHRDCCPGTFLMCFLWGQMTETL